MRIDMETKRLPADRVSSERRKRLEAWIDAGGCCLLREPIIAQMVTDTLHYLGGQRYRLCAWVVMPNHIHVLFETLDDWSVAKIVASWKKHTAVQINAYLKSDEQQGANQEIGVPRGGPRRAPVWHREYWDRFIRNEHHFLKTVEYIHQNPAKAGLVSADCDWPWSSARFYYTGNALGTPILDWPLPRLL